MPKPGEPPPPEEQVRQASLQLPYPPGDGLRDGALAAAASGLYVSPELGRVAAAQATVVEPRIINLLRVPGPQQALLKVRVAELNRTALREIGADLTWVDSDSGRLIGTQIGGGTVHGSGIVGPAGGLLTNRSPVRTFFDTSPATTVFGIFEGTDFEVL